MEIQTIAGNVCAPQGFQAAGVHCGIRKKRTKLDLALIYSKTPCTAAGVYTKNLVKAAPILLTMEHLKNGRARAILANSGNANACAPNGEINALRSCACLADALGIDPADVAVASTGVIGQELNIAAIENGIPALAAALSDTGGDDAADAIMTTDLVKKEIAIEFMLAGKPVRMGGIAKGSGMIHPNMGTMLAFLTTDCAIAAPLLAKALKESAKRTYNRVSVDGDTSTNDMCVILANGLAQNEPVAEENGDYEAFLAALDHVNGTLARAIAADGEGATKLITVTVAGAADEETAERLAMGIASSSLTKAAMFGADANWGRILCAMGYSGAAFDPDTTDVSFLSNAGTVHVCANGRGLAFDEALAKRILSEPEVTILVSLAAGTASVTAWGCDLTYDYVRINGDYRS